MLSQLRPKGEDHRYSPNSEAAPTLPGVSDRPRSGPPVLTREWTWSAVSGPARALPNDRATAIAKGCDRRRLRSGGLPPKINHRRRRSCCRAGPARSARKWPEGRSSACRGRRTSGRPNRACRTEKPFFRTGSCITTHNRIAKRRDDLHIYTHLLPERFFQEMSQTAPEAGRTSAPPPCVA